MVTDDDRISHFKSKRDMIAQPHISSTSEVGPMSDSGAKCNGVAGDYKRFEFAVSSFG